MKRYQILTLMTCFSPSLFAAPVYDTSAFKPAAKEPISIRAVSGSTIPSQTNLNEFYVVKYKLTSNLPFNMPSAFNNSFSDKTRGNEFTITDNCHGVSLAKSQSCDVTVSLKPTSAGRKSANLSIGYGSTRVPLNFNSTTKSGSSHTATDWTQFLGVNYQPNHYPNGSSLNDHDVFYAGTYNGVAATNVYAELSQLKAAGFTAVRSYQTVPYAWIDIIKQAKALNMKVIYEASIPFNGNNADITSAVSILNKVIDGVGNTTFKDTVILVFAGHENYDNTNIQYLTNAVTQLQATLSGKSITTIPVGSALVSGDLISADKNIISDMTTLIGTYSPDAPLGFDPYPFQWGVTPPNQAVSNAALSNSIAWDYAKVFRQSFYISPRTVLMAETGWATQGTGTYAGYYCATQNNCAPSVPNAGQYLSELYTYINVKSNKSGALVFEAYDEPAKDPAHADNAENYYGVFSSDCVVKDLSLIPNGSFTQATNPGCKGMYDNGALLTVVGGSVTTQPRYSVQITQTNPSANSLTGNISVSIAKKNRTDPTVFPWPQFLVFNNAVVKITGSATGNICTTTVTVANRKITAFSAVSCTNGQVVNCTVETQDCFLPANF